MQKVSSRWLARAPTHSHFPGTSVHGQVGAVPRERQPAARLATFNRPISTVAASIRLKFTGDVAQFLLNILASRFLRCDAWSLSYGRKTARKSVFPTFQRAVVPSKVVGSPSNSLQMLSSTSPFDWRRVFRNRTKTVVKPFWEFSRITYMNKRGWIVMN